MGRNLKFDHTISFAFKTQCFKNNRELFETIAEDFVDHEQKNGENARAIVQTKYTERAS